MKLFDGNIAVNEILKFEILKDFLCWNMNTTQANKALPR